MTLNLIRDPWIPVLRGGTPGIIRPAQIAEPGVERLNWPRPDLNLACMELLIGLIYLAEPPADADDWKSRLPDAERLQNRLDGWATAFNLTGSGPLFMQDWDELPGDPAPLDMLFIDSSGGQTIRNNADLMVRRARYPALSLPLAAMALYAFQAFAPAGGAGNRTSMRGGGPMVSLVSPRGAGPALLWSLLWANVPEVRPEDAYQPDEMDAALPWMRPTRTSEKGKPTVTPQGATLEPETFFGMPRRLRLVAGEGECALSGAAGPVATGVVQRPYGANYENWVHPLSPYYRDAKGLKLPKHPKPGRLLYPGWAGILFKSTRGNGAEPADCVKRYRTVHRRENAHLLIGGWAMDNMKPLDFLWAETPLFPLSEQAEQDAERFVNAAEQAAFALNACLRECLKEDDAGKGTAGKVRETFYELTQLAYERALARLSAGEAATAVAPSLLQALAETALKLFDRHTQGLLFGSDMDKTQALVNARKKLFWSLKGYPPMGKKLFEHLGLPVPEKRKSEDVA